MKFTLTADQVAVLRKDALAVQNNAEFKVQEAREALRLAEAEFNRARTFYNGTLTVRTGSEVQIDFSSAQPAVVIPEPDDKRPKGWEAYNGFRVPSRSGRGKSHEICANGRTNSPGTEMSCSCPAFTFRGGCWATRAVRRGVKWDEKSTMFIEDDEGVRRNAVLILHKGRTDFGMSEKP
jgi:hypothetical protein